MKNKKRHPFRGSSGDRPLIARIIAIIIVVFLAISMIITFLPSFVFSAEAGGNTSGQRPPLVIDDADILTDEEETELNAGLESFRKDQDFDIVVLTVDSLDGYDVVDYADIFYDKNGYGGGEEHDGVLILVSTEYRDWTMITAGYGITAITDYSLDEIEKEILPDLSAGRYLKAFEGFADHCANCVLEARSGNIIDQWIEDNPAETGEGTNSGSSHKEYPWAVNVGISGLIGIVVSWFSNGRKKSQMKSVRHRTQAREYVRRDSMRITESRDRFLYHTVNRVPISREKNDNKPGGHFGGSTIHTSLGGGGFHGGGHSGKF